LPNFAGRPSQRCADEGGTTFKFNHLAGNLPRSAGS
jgi:hypothetical protein